MHTFISDEPRLAECLRAISKQKGLVAIVSILIAIAAFQILGTMRPVYDASAVVAFESPSVGLVNLSTQLRDPAILSDLIRQTGAEISPEALSARLRVSADNNLVWLSVRARNHEEGLALAKALAVHVIRTQQSIAPLSRSLLTDLKTLEDSLQHHLEALRMPVQSPQEPSRRKTKPPPTEQEAFRKSERLLLEETRLSIQSIHRQAWQLDQKLSTAILEPYVMAASSRPISLWPALAQRAFLAGVVGLAIGTLVALFAEAMQRKDPRP